MRCLNDNLGLTFIRSPGSKSVGPLTKYLLYVLVESLFLGSEGLDVALGSLGGRPSTFGLCRRRFDRWRRRPVWQDAKRVESSM